MHVSHRTTRPEEASYNRGIANDAAELRGILSPGLCSAAFVRAASQIARFARHPSIPVLLEGEAGTGKTTFAREIHRLSPRAAGPFCHVLLSSLDDALAASELFGHVAGAFTDARRNRHGQFASASGGTLFLDEIGKASRSVQQKLLHAIEYREIRPVGSDRPIKIDTRIIVATNVSLNSLVDEGLFLPDLLARLEVYRIELPPLRERRGDIRALTASALTRHATECGYSSVPTVDALLMDALESANWPNNVRQLDATVQRLLVEAEGSAILNLSHCRDSLAYLRDARPAAALTRETVELAIAREGGVTAAAKSLGVHRTTLHRHLREARSESEP